MRKIIPRRIIIYYKLLDDNIKELVSGTLAGLMVKTLAAFSNFVFNVVLIRKLGVESSGFFFVFMSISIILSAFARMGVDNSLVKNFAILIDKNKADIGSVYKKVLIISCITSGILAAISILSSSFLICVFKFDSIHQTEFNLFMLSVLFVTVNILNAQSLQGVKSIKESLLLVSCIVPLSVTVMLILSNDVVSLAEATKYYLFSLLFSIILGFYFLKKKNIYPISRINNSNNLSLKFIYSGTLPLMLIFISSLIFQWGGQLILGIYSTPNEVSEYQAIQKTSYLMTFVLLAVNGISAPKFSQSYSNNNMSALRKLVGFSGLSIALISIPLACVMIFFDKAILDIFNLNLSNNGYLAFKVAVFAQLINVLTGSNGYLLIMTGNEKYQLISATVSTIFFISCGYLLREQSSFGLLISFSISIVLLNSLSTMFVYRRLQIITFQESFRAFNFLLINVVHKKSKKK